MNENTKTETNPEDDYQLQVRAGAGLRYWSLGYSTTNNTLTAEFEPSTVAILNAKMLNVYGFDISLDYLTNKISKSPFAQTSSVEDLSQEATIASLAGEVLFGIEDSEVVVYSEARTFEGRGKVTGINLSTNSINRQTLPQGHYLGQSGSVQRLNEDSQIGWFSEFLQLDAYVRRPFTKNLKIGIGLGQIQYNAVTRVSIDEANFGGNSIDFADVLIDNTYETINLIYYLEFVSYLSETTSFHLRIPINTGVGRTYNQYFLSDYELLSNIGYTVKTSLQFKSEKTSLIIGFDWTYLQSSFNQSSTTLKKGLPLASDKFNNTFTIPRGTKLKFSVDRKEDILGPSVEFRYQF